jgi:hypothetical protein
LKSILPCIIAHFRPVATMSKRSKKPHSHETPTPAVPPARRVATRRAIAERKLRIVERLTSGLSVAHIAHVEQLTIQRVRQIIAEMLERREVDPPSGYVQLQIARVGEAMVVAHTMMLQGDLQALDRLIKLNGELDRYHGFGREQLPAPAESAPPRLVAPPQRLLAASLAADGSEGKLSASQSLEKSGNQKIPGPPCSPSTGR